MTMLGRFKTQKFLRAMVKAGCGYAVIETSSEGIKQHRHLGLNYDIAVFTNLTPEHLESHGGFENYQQAKGELFRHLTQRRKKTLNGRMVDKTIIVNADDQNAPYFLNFPADKKITYAINRPADYRATDIELRSNGAIFTVNGSAFKSNLYGHVNIYNELAALAVAKSQQVNDDQIRLALMQFKSMPGRFEFIEEASALGFKVMVDYAPEPESMKQLYETLKIFDFNKIIHVLGSCGGGRDKARQPILGNLAATRAQNVIVTNEDPYDDNPMTIIDNVAQGAIEAGKVLNENLFKILNRHDAIAYALSLARAGDLVLITGKGCEQFICVAHGKKIPWDDREAVKELLAGQLAP
ncbi:MAG: hypothetical protein A3J95_03245 [Candidatus Komeilibacteria bacterium RIFOXYC2_FULL_45_12]|nr:MAG: hypothetical protein A3J95_03245 [Candidatus Komeilibacteria bacterium RIFOXYC2_FULL_45_12]